MLKELSIKGGIDLFGDRGFFTQKSQQQLLGKRIQREQEQKAFDFRTANFQYQTTYDVNDYVQDNGYLPQKLLNRGLNYVDKSLAKAKQLPLAMVKKRPAPFIIDKRIDTAVDEYFRKIVRPRQQLLDSEHIALQQLKAAHGLRDRSLMQLPLPSTMNSEIINTLEKQGLVNDMLKPNKPSGHIQRPPFKGGNGDNNDDDDGDDDGETGYRDAISTFTKILNQSIGSDGNNNQNLQPFSAFENAFPQTDSDIDNFLFRLNDYWKGVTNEFNLDDNQTQQQYDNNLPDPFQKSEIKPESVQYYPQWPQDNDPSQSLPDAPGDDGGDDQPPPGGQKIKVGNISSISEEESKKSNKTRQSKRYPGTDGGGNRGLDNSSSSNNSDGKPDDAGGKGIPASSFVSNQLLSTQITLKRPSRQNAVVSSQRPFDQGDGGRISSQPPRPQVELNSNNRPGNVYPLLTGFLNGPPILPSQQVESNRPDNVQYYPSLTGFGGGPRPSQPNGILQQQFMNAERYGTGRVTREERTFTTVRQSNGQTLTLVQPPGQPIPNNERSESVQQRIVNAVGSVIQRGARAASTASNTGTQIGRVVAQAGADVGMVIMDKIKKNTYSLVRSSRQTGGQIANSAFNAFKTSVIWAYRGVRYTVAQLYELYANGTLGEIFQTFQQVGIVTVVGTFNVASALFEVGSSVAPYIVSFLPLMSILTVARQNLDLLLSGAQRVMNNMRTNGTRVLAQSFGLAAEIPEEITSTVMAHFRDTAQFIYQTLAIFSQDENDMIENIREMTQQQIRTFEVMLTGMLARNASDQRLEVSQNQSGEEFKEREEQTWAQTAQRWITGIQQSNQVGQYDLLNQQQREEIDDIRQHREDLVQDLQAIERLRIANQRVEMLQRRAIVQLGLIEPQVQEEGPEVSNQELEEALKERNNALVYLSSEGRFVSKRMKRKVYKIKETGVDVQERANQIAQRIEEIKRQLLQTYQVNVRVRNEVNDEIMWAREAQPRYANLIIPEESQRREAELPPLQEEEKESEQPRRSYLEGGRSRVRR